jgi:hypothetical protein
MAIIPITLLIAAQIPLRKKLVIALVLCSGAFCIAATMIRCIFTVANIGNVPDTIIWGCREIVVMIVAVCTPVIKVFLFSSKRAERRTSGVYEINDECSERETRRSTPAGLSQHYSAPAGLDSIHIPPHSPWLWSGMEQSNASNDSGEIFIFSNNHGQTSSNMDPKPLEIAVQYEVKVTSSS